MLQILVLLMLLTTAGCVADAILRDPVTGQTVNCTAMGQYQGYPAYGRGASIGAGAASGMASALGERSCINSYMGAGFRCLSGICAQ